MSTHELIELQGLAKRYGRKVTLQFPELTINQSDRIAVRGGNGSGKSTLLRIIVGLTRPDSGRARYMPASRTLRIGYLPQEGGLYRDLDVEQNLRVFRRLLGKPADDGPGTELAELLGISVSSGKKVAEFSGGEQKLAAIYCLLCSGAGALVMDEPFASLGDVEQERARKALLAVWERYAFLIASWHVSELSDLLSDWTRVVTLNGGVADATALV